MALDLFLSGAKSQIQTLMSSNVTPTATPSNPAVPASVHVVSEPQQEKKTTPPPPTTEDIPNDFGSSFVPDNEPSGFSSNAFEDGF